MFLLQPLWTLIYVVEDLLRQMSHLQVTMRRGFVESLQWIQDRWEIDDGRLTAARVFLATGSVPQEPVGFPGVPRVSLDDALIASKLSGWHLLAHPLSEGCSLALRDGGW